MTKTADMQKKDNRSQRNFHIRTGSKGMFCSAFPLSEIFTGLSAKNRCNIPKKRGRFQMRNSLPQFVLGYHGCDLSLVRQLLNAETQLKFSRNSYDWLSRGIYFWENAPCRAMDWALECQKKLPDNKGKSN